jgi:hypothetical protein
MANKCLSVPTFLILALLANVTSGCGGAKREHGPEHAFAMASLGDMPAEVQAAPVSVQEAYQFAMANPDTLAKIPCYCGCGAMGHRSNADCYISAEDRGEGLMVDNHALGCSICVDISQDVMRMMDQGKDMAEIYAYVDDTYARFGPPTPLAQ